MDTKQIEYILKIAEENNITHAASKLFITQPALNQQLLRLEKELGTQLFHRSRTDWRPTEAGHIYLENAKNMLQLKHQTYRKIGDIVSDKKGHLSVGLTPGRGIAMFSAVYPKFHQEYPDVIVTPKELSVTKQQTMITTGELDIGFLTLCDNHRTSDVYVPITQEEIFLVIPEKHPLSIKHKKCQGGNYPTLDIRLLQYEPFVLMYKESTIRQLIDETFIQADFHPNVLFETSSTATILTMIQSNLCCGLIPHYYLKDKCHGLSCFSIPSKPSWDIMASYKKNSYLTHAASYFIELATRFWNPDSFPTTTSPK